MRLVKALALTGLALLFACQTTTPVVIPQAPVVQAPQVPSGPTEPPPAIEKPCLAQTFNFPAVRAACEKGGVPKAKSLMKAWTNKGKAAGEAGGGDEEHGRDAKDVHGSETSG